MILSLEYNLLFLSTHISKKIDEFLRCLADIAELTKKYQNNLDWDYIVASARLWQNRIPVYYALRRARDILGTPVPTSVFDEL